MLRDAARRALELGLDLIITDHHQPPEILPAAFAVINPQRVDSRFPFRDLAGVGVSYNTFVWSKEMDPKAGMLRLVAGLGTRAVDRVEGDYPRIVALDAPLKRPLKGFEDARRFAQRDQQRHRIEDPLPFLGDRRERQLAARPALGESLQFHRGLALIECCPPDPDHGGRMLQLVPLRTRETAHTRHGLQREAGPQAGPVHQSCGRMLH